MTGIITLTTDFGVDSPYVAVLKGVILSLQPDVRLIDISHSIPPQDVRQGAVELAETTPWFPAGTIHLAVVDPGVGTERKIVYAEIGDQRYVCPDNGLLSRLTLKQRPGRVVAVENSEHWLPAVSQTFHGRDIMAPVAAAISLGGPPERLGSPLTKLVELQWLAPKIGARQIAGSVEWIDPFGNLITNIAAGMLPREPLEEVSASGRITIEIEGHSIDGLTRAYGDRPAKSLIALIGSGGYLEIAIAGGSAVKEIGGQVGACVLLRW
jgi:S-adenosylmethionine hydrolase